MARPAPVHPLRILLALTRWRVAFAVALSAGMGYLLAASRLGWGLGAAMAGVFLLASGASALNQAQDALLDARMERTRRRPIPSKRVRSSTAVFLSGVLMLLGLYCLASAPEGNEQVLLLAAGAAAWYNGVYTYLKRITPFAVAPGALIGAAPPLIGGMAAGQGAPLALAGLAAAFLFVWQLPHFWLLQIMRQGDYRQAGLPVLADRFSPNQLRRITASWVFAAAAAGLVFPAMAGRQIGAVWRVAVLCASLWLAAQGLRLWLSAGELELIARAAFRRVNVYAVAVCLSLSLNALQRILAG